MACISLLVLSGAPLGAQTAESRPWEFDLGRLRLLPSGFLENIAEVRSVHDPDSISTRFGAFPLASTSGPEFLDSMAHSRFSLKGSIALGNGATLAGYMESDFLNPVSGANPYRWRQYWGELDAGNWRVLGGQAWSLLRPNRRGTASDRDMMNTDVVEPAYHVGLVGSRRKQVRVTRVSGAWQIAVAWESEGNVLAKWVRDTRRLHWELGGTGGRQQRRGAVAAAVWHLTPRVRAVTQQFWAHRAGFEALGVVPVGVNGFSTLEGIEATVTRRIELYGYWGIVYGARSAGNRTVSEWTIGATHRTELPTARGGLLVSFEVSRLDRSLWNGPSGAMTYAMARMRYFLR